jgi:TRAP-type C4-dicarboxylate transport system permease small subunit
MRAIRGLDWLLGWLENIVLSASIMAMAVLNIANVLGNNLVGSGLPFTIEINQALLVIITFIGVSKGARHGRNIRMSAIYDQAKGHWRKAMNLIITTGSALVMFYLCWYAIEYEQQVRSIGQTTPNLGIPLWVVYLAVPFGLFLAGLQYSLTTLRNLTSSELYRSFTELEVYEEADLAAVEGEKLEGADADSDWAGRRDGQPGADDDGGRR